MKTVTIDEVMAWKPCEDYPRERVEMIGAGRTEITALEACDLDIPVADRVWLVLHMLNRVDLYFLAAEFAESVLHIWERAHPNDLRPRHAIRAARLYAMGEIDVVTRAAAEAAARAAARAAAEAAASWAAARAAAEAAASWAAASIAAARAASWAAARDADEAAEAAERTKQLEIVRQYIIQKELSDDRKTM